MAHALESGDPDQALSTAQGMHPEQHPYSSRRAAYWVDCGRALARLRGRRDDAVMALPYDRIALPGHPQDRDQICPDCSRAKAAL